MRNFILVLFFLFGATGVWAQSPQIRMPEPLSVYQNATVEALFEDKGGNIWIGAANGLILYNGLEAKLFTRADSLADNHVTAITQDSSGAVWIGHNNGHISIYKNNKLSAFQPYEGVPRKRITSMLAATNGAIWFATDSVGLWFYDGKRVNIFDQDNGLVEASTDTAGAKAETDEFAGMIPGLEGDAGLTLTKKTLEIYCLLEDANGHIWVGTDAGITIIDPTKKDKSRFSYLTMKSGLPDNIVRELHHYGQNSIQITFLDGGIGYYDLKTKKFSILPGWSFGSINTACPSSNHETFIAARDGKVYFYSPKTQSYNLIRTFNKEIQTMTEDHEGNLWLGTKQGCYQVAGDRFEFLSMKDGLPSNNVSAFLRDSDGNFWVGSEVGLTRYTPAAMGEPEVKTIKPKIAGSDKTAQILSIVEDRLGNIWAGSYGAGLLKINAKTLGIQTYGAKNGLPNNDVKALAVAPNGDVWAGTLGGGLVVVKLNEKGDVDKLVVCRDSAKASELYFDVSYIYNLQFDPRGRLWIATDGAGLVKFDGKAYERTSEKFGLDVKTVYSIAPDHLGNVWFGVAGEGVYKFDGKTFKNYNLKNGLRDDFAEAMTVDRNNRLIIANRFGIDQLDIASGKFIYYGSDEGLAGAEPQTNAIYYDREGAIWIGTVKGVLKYQPESMFPRNVAPLLQITRLRILLKDTPLDVEPEFNYNQNHFTFDFMGVSMSAPHKVVYQYKLEGYDEDWSLETQARFVTYSNLPPGTYTFMVRANNGNGQWSEKPVTYAFTIHPPFWRTWWFIILSILLVGGTVYSMVRFRLRQIQKEKEVLEQKVAERTQEISRKNEQILQKSSELEQANEELNTTLEQVQAQSKIIERKNNDILESIHYAERLQNAILPEMTKIKEHLPDSFIFYQPKDIISGDFYWFSSVENKAILAAVDCTGHGVPGAFMSVVGYNQLNEVVNSLKITDPAKILTELDIRVRRTLKQDDQQSVTKDGMDVALCVCDVENRVVEFAGAFRPLFVYRNGEMEELKGSRFPIGGAQAENKEFEYNRLELNEGDCVFFFSDGFVDQFGGDKGRKFTPKRLRETLINNIDRPFNELAFEMSVVFNKWKGDGEQLDDVLLIGIKF